MSKEAVVERDDYGKALDYFEARLKERINGEVHVFYSAYKTKNEVPVDNLDEVAIQGKVFAICLSPDCVHPTWVEVSKLMENPTWLDLAVVSNDFIRLSGDYHHRFFEGFKLSGKAYGDIKIVEFFMGS